MVTFKGNEGNIQNDIDFYLTIIAKGETKSPKELRDKYFSIFEEEDSYRKENYLAYQEEVDDDYKIDYSKEPSLVGEEMVFDDNVNYFSSKSEATQDDIKQVHEDVQEKSKDVKEQVVSEDLSSISMFLKSEENEVEDEDFSDTWGNDEELVEDDDDLNDTWGSDDEEIVEEDIENDEDDEYDEDLNSSWGNDEEDEILDEDSEELSNTWGSDEEDEIEEEDWEEDEDLNNSWGNNEEDEILDEDSEELSGTWGNDEEDEILDEDSEELSDTWGTEDYEEEDIEIPSQQVVEESIKPKGNTLEGLGVYKGSEIIEKEQVTEVKNIVVDDVVQNNTSTITEVPKDLRDFIKMYPNTEMSVVLKYFSKREIDRQLSLGRVFKRKNKLMI